MLAFASGMRTATHSQLRHESPSYTEPHVSKKVENQRIKKAPPNGGAFLNLLPMKLSPPRRWLSALSPSPATGSSDEGVMQPRGSLFKKIRNSFWSWA